MNGHLPWILVPTALTLTVGMAVTAVHVLREAERRKRLAARLSTVANVEARRPRASLRPIARAATRNRLTTRQRIAAQFGFDPERTAHYPLRPWMILVLTGILSRLLAMLSSSMLGNLSLLLMPIAWVLLSRMAFSALDNRFTGVLRQQFPDALQMIVRSVRVGIPVTEAIRVVGREAPQPTGGEFTRMAGELAIGTQLEDAIKAMALRTGLAEYSFFATTISLQATAGGGLGETLEGLAEVIRKRLALRSKGMAMASQARTSAAVLVALPFVSGGGMYLLNKAYIGLLFVDPLGIKFLGAGAASLVVGVLIMRAIIQKSLA